jgi:hypothetical protein
VGDYWEAIAEAERTRMLSVLGLYELRGVLERYESEHGVSYGASDLDAAQRGEMQALWERAELAAAAIATDFAAINAQALLAMNGALDAMVEQFVPAIRDMAVSVNAKQLVEAAEQAHPEVASQLDEATREALVEAVVATINESLPKLKRPKGSGVRRYETLLRKAGLGTPQSRLIPADWMRHSQSLGRSVTC